MPPLPGTGRDESDALLHPVARVGQHRHAVLDLRRTGLALAMAQAGVRERDGVVIRPLRPDTVPPDWTRPVMPIPWRALAICAVGTVGLVLLWCSILGWV